MTALKTTPPRFSVIMNVFNGKPYVRAAIESVLTQTFQDFELILWDNKSTDGTAEICASYDDPRIRLFFAESNDGLGAARNGAIAVATGEWVAFLDHDDIWTPDKLAAQNALIEADQTGRLGLIYGRTQRFDDTGPLGPFDPWYRAGHLPEGDIFDALLARATFIAVSSVAFKRAALTAIGCVPSQLRHTTDYYLCAMIARNHTAACVQTLCCHYRVHQNNMSYVFRRRCCEEALYIMDQVARPTQRRLVRKRARVFATLIGVDDFRSGQWGSGISRIIRRGSVSYLTVRPLVGVYRRLRNRIRPT